MPWNRDEIARRAARELLPGSIVNLGIGIPTLVANHVTPDQGITFHSENGLLGMGPFPYPGEVDAQVINAGKQTVTVAEGGSTFDSALSFAMIRGGHVDVAVLGAMEVAANGDLANWMVPGKKVAGIGGAMDLANGAKRVIALLFHRDRQGQPKLVAHCSLPLTAMACVDTVISDLGVFDVDRDANCFIVRELAPDCRLEEVRQATNAPLYLAEDRPAEEPAAALR